MIYKNIYSSPIGALEVSCDEEHLLAIEFVRKKMPHGDDKQSPLMKKICRQLKEYFSGKRKEFDIPISFKKLGGTEFQRSAWREMCNIPYGETITYKKEATELGKPLACRAVGNANGQNPIPIVIPCHRVIASNNKLGGYSSGLWRKKALLNLERVRI